MKTPLDLFYDGCDVYGKHKYGKEYKTHRDTEQFNSMTRFAINYMLNNIYETYTTKEITKANAESKRKDGYTTANTVVHSNVVFHKLHPIIIRVIVWRIASWV